MRALTVCIHSGRKSDVYWLYFPNMLDLSGCLSQRNDWWLLLIVWAGRKESAGNSLLQFKLVFEPVAVLSLGIPSVTCHMRGKWWCGRPFGLLFDLEFLFPSESHLLRQSPSQVQRKKRGAGESSWLSDWNCEKKRSWQMDKTQARWQISVGEITVVSLVLIWIWTKVCSENSDILR